jgi:hypothetical protein
MNKRMAIFVLCLFVQGCFWPFSGQRRSVEVVPAVFIQTLNEEGFLREGTVAFIPFAAGANAEAGETLDRLTLVIVKAAADALADSSSAIRVETSEDLGASRYLLEGHVEEFRPPSRFIWRRKDGVLAVRAHLRERDTGRRVALIFGKKDFKRAKDSGQAALEIGQGIAGVLAR